MVRIADIVKVDVLALGRAGVEAHVNELRKFDVELLAEKVETHEQFQFCEQMGFDYFQGFFACRPQILAQRAISPHRLGTLQLLSRLQDENLQILELDGLLRRDPALCLKLLRFINSSYCGLKSSVESIRHAATLVGLKKIRTWAGLLAFGDFSDKPSELIRTTNIRARMCERLAHYLVSQEADRSFTVGLFSLLDAFADQPLDAILAQLPLSPEINAALLRGEGPAGRILKCVTAYEQANWREVNLLGLPADIVRNAYLDALTWTDSLFMEMRSA
jgi:EAL and modified HD-GYP domain-containing signal transduction protein